MRKKIKDSFVGFEVIVRPFDRRNILYRKRDDEKSLVHGQNLLEILLHRSMWLRPDRDRRSWEKKLRSVCNSRAVRKKHVISIVSLRFKGLLVKELLGISLHARCRFFARWNAERIDKCAQRKPTSIVCTDAQGGKKCFLRILSVTREINFDFEFEVRKRNFDIRILRRSNLFEELRAKKVDYAGWKKKNLPVKILHLNFIYFIVWTHGLKVISGVQAKRESPCILSSNKSDPPDDWNTDVNKGKENISFSLKLNLPR